MYQKLSFAVWVVAGSYTTPDRRVRAGPRRMMYENHCGPINIFALFISFTVLGVVNAQTVGVGAGSYTTSVPPGFAGPQSTIYESHGGPIPTHKFWTSKYWNPHGFAPGPIYMFPEPLSIQVTANGLVAGYFPRVNNNGLWFNKPFQPDLTVGVDGLNAGAVNVSRYSDWTVRFQFRANHDPCRSRDAVRLCNHEWQQPDCYL